MFLLTLANVVYVLVAIAMIVMILLQRGAGAQAGSGFGAGASATVFGSRGSANFLSKSTAVLATVFFVLSLGMAIYASRTANTGPSPDDAGVMGSLAPTEVPTAAPAAAISEVPSAGADAKTDAMPAPEAPTAAVQSPESAAADDKPNGN